MLGNLLVLLTFISFVAIFYFWLKKHDKKWVIISIVATIIFGTFYSFTPEYKEEQAKQAQEKKARNNEAKRRSSIKKQNNKKSQSSTKKARKSSNKSTKSRKTQHKETSKSTLLKRAKKLKYGMTIDKVKKVMKVKPSKEEKDEVGNMTLMWGNDVVYLSFDKNNKLNQAIEGAPQIEKQAKTAAKNKTKNKEENNNKLIGFAQAFGTKPSEEIQRMPSVYKTLEYGNDLYIIWSPGNGLPTLLRVDDTVNNVTKVYKYDKNSNDRKGKLLYTGRTIIQRNKRPIIYY